MERGTCGARHDFGALALLFARIGVLALRLDRAVRGEDRRGVAAIALACLTLPIFGTSILVLPELPAGLLCLLFALGALRSGQWKAPWCVGQVGLEQPSNFSRGLSQEPT